jgi:proton-dependent oligopeptide transporter, POT family
LEKYRGFWTAYLLPVCSFWIGVVLLIVWRNDFGRSVLSENKRHPLTLFYKVKFPPEGNVLPRAAKVLLYASRDRFNLDAAKQAYQLEKHGRIVPWNDHFIAEIKRGLLACRVMSV